MLDVALLDNEEIPSDMQEELARMTWLDERKLWSIARSAMPKRKQDEMRRLAELQTQRPLTKHEQQALETLRQEYGKVTLRKARAYAVLSLRSGCPLLMERGSSA
jgi:hypothetical protein